MRGFLAPRVGSRSHRGVGRADLLAFFSQLSTLFKAGTPLLEAVTIASEQTDSTRLSGIAARVARAIAGGGSLHEALLRFPRHFRPEWIAVIRGGEESGKLGPVLEALVEQILAETELRRRLLGALSYPLLVLVVSTVCVAVMLVAVVPAFARMFEGLGKSLPPVTEHVLQASRLLRRHGLLLAAAATAACLLARVLLRTPLGRGLWDRLRTGLPLFGDIVVQRTMQRFACNLALLLRAGLPILDALTSLRRILGSNSVYDRALHHVERRVGAGAHVAVAMGETGVFTPLVTRLVHIGEESGALPAVLDEADLLYRRRVATAVGVLTRSIETFALLFMAGGVAVILGAIYLPLFSMASGV